ncbi:Gfo/Idh/MocA family protein [Gracilibacillus kekensis]|uniref:Predicted dehydrogenase n=1 Tax=Gracilibacillus kekensis TaxID=1027249 RepID=A0A1M7LBM5_9BACI|nr:Gfo/Idh/MocA family oxidoreductase [Gracilibacillus kekensis]SHM75512.1 Predicted dehydrogenase [Gracilibacillus kekensis]
MEKIRIGFIGTGGMAQVHASQLLELDNVEISAITDVSAEAREQFISQLGLTNVKQFKEYHDMLEQAELDGVIICSPHTLHFEQATTVLERGLHVLIEKPMTCSSREAEQLIETAKQSGKIMQVSYQRHFQPEFIYIHDAIASGKIGEVTSVTASLYQQWWRGSNDTYSWRKDPKLSGGGFLMDSGSHIIDVLLWTTGLTPAHVTSQLSQQGAPVEIDTFTSIQFKEGAVAGLNLVGYSPTWHETYVFCGEKGAIFYENDKITLHMSGEEPIHPQLPKPTTNQDKSFIDAICGEHEVQVPGEFALKVVKLSEMIYKSAGYKPY